MKGVHYIVERKWIDIPKLLGPGWGSNYDDGIRILFSDHADEGFGITFYLSPVDTVWFVTNLIEDVILTSKSGGNETPEIPFVVVAGVVGVSWSQCVPID